MPLQISGDPQDVQRLAEALRRTSPTPVVLETKATNRVCPLCRMAYEPREACSLPLLQESEVCNLCHQVALRVLGRFREDARRHQRDFLGNLRQMVRDVRSGADEPTFYRGFEG